MSSTPVSRRCLVATISGSKPESRSPGHGDFHRPGIGEHGLGAVATAGIAAVTAGRIILLIAQVIIQLAFQRALDHHFHQPPQQAAPAGQRPPAGAGPIGTPADQLLIGRRQLHPVPAPACRHVSHLVSPPSRKLHR